VETRGDGPGRCLGMWDSASNGGVYESSRVEGDEVVHGTCRTKCHRRRHVLKKESSFNTISVDVYVLILN